MTFDLEASASAGRGRDAPITLSETASRSLGLRDALARWGNLGISLLLLGLGPAAGAAQGVPAIVLMRGLIGRWGSAVPTGFNLFQSVDGRRSRSSYRRGGYVLPRGPWDVAETAPARPAMLLPWIAGFVAYQLTLPTYFSGTGQAWTSWWADRQSQLGIDAANGWSASLVSLAVAVSLMIVVGLPGVVRRRRQTS